MRYASPQALVSALALTLVSACSNEVALLEQPIVGGTSGGDPAVLWIYNSVSGDLCSSALIDPRVVLTAKHCVQEAGASGPVPTSEIVVGVGDRVGSGRTFAVQTIHTTPGSYSDGGEGLVGRDIAVLVLSTGPSDIAPIPVRRASPIDLAGDTITACGFGQTPSGGAGQKYTADGRVSGVGDDLIYVGSLICQGDSGGPMITSEREVAGVVSFGNGNCGSGFGVYNAVYRYLDLVDAALEEGGGCTGDEEIETRCDARDNDCDGELDEPCTPIGGACSSDALCVGNMCRSIALPDGTTQSICVRECDARRPGLGCGEGFSCARVEAGACGGVCLPIDAPGALADEMPCASDGECASRYCADPGEGTRRCLTPCELGAGACFAGEVCVAPSGACGGCVPAEIVIGLGRTLGEPCRSSAECLGHAECYDEEGSSYCTRACGAGEESCPRGFHCRERRCVRGTLGGVGESCVSDEDCTPGTMCALEGARSFCTSLCGEGRNCPDRFRCVSAGGAMVCAPPPEAGLIGDPCDMPEDCISGLCASARVCSRACSAVTPCGPGFECRRTREEAGAVCLRATPRSGGGCSAAGVPARGASGGGLVILAILAISKRRERG